MTAIFNSFVFNGLPFNGPGTAPTPTPMPSQVQLTTLPDFFISVLTFISNIEIEGTPLFGSGSVYYSIDPDADEEYPMSPPPFAILDAESFEPNDWVDGGGRFATVYDTAITVHVVVRNTLDPAFMANNVMTSTDTTVGVYQIVQSLIDNLQQGYITDNALLLQLVTLPVAGPISKPRRKRKAGEYVEVSVRFAMQVGQSFLANLP